MADIRFTNFLIQNPGLEDVLDPDGAIGTADATTFEIINNDVGSPWENFVFRLTGTDFTYDGTTPAGGTITGIEVLDGNGDSVATVTGSIFNANLAAFWNALGTSALAALDTALGGSNRTAGSVGDDRLTSYGNGGDMLGGGDGSDTLWIRGSHHIAEGGGSDDLFRIDNSPNGSSSTGLSIHGGGSDGSGGADTDTIEFGGTFAAFSEITNIDALRFADASGLSQQFRLTTSQIGAGLVSATLAVDGSAGSGQDLIDIFRHSSGSPVNLDLSGWTFTNWTRAEQSVQISLFGDSFAPQIDNVLGTSANDRISGVFGPDRLDGGAGDDLVNIDRRDKSVAFTLDLSDPETQTDIGDGTTLIRIERAEFFAGSGDDSLTGGALADTLHGGDGDDTIRSGGGPDHLNGGRGADTFIYGAGEATAGGSVSGGDFATGDIDTLLAQGDNDFSGVFLSNIQRIVFDGAASLTFGNSISNISPTFVGDAGANALHIVLSAGGRGTTGASVSLDRSTLESWTAGADTVGITGTAFDDFIGAPTVAADLDGGDGTDLLRIDRSSASAAYMLDLSAPATRQTLADGSTVFNFERLSATFGAGDDQIIGGDFRDFMSGGAGEDVLHGGAGHDDLRGEDGDDILDGGAGGDSLLGGAGDDQLFSRLNEGGTGTGPSGTERLDGGDGIDFAFIDRSTNTRSFNLDLGDPSIQTDLGDRTTVINIERIEFRAGFGNDTLTGGVLADVLRGGAGRDFISGGAGDDVVEGGAGVDLLDGGDGADTIAGGAGIDILDGGAGNDTLDGGSEADTIDGGEGDDLVLGGRGADNLAGNVGNDTLDGGAGIDVMSGGEGDDVFHVDNGADDVFEAEGEGEDRVLAAVSYTLTPDSEIELLVTGNEAGTGAINLTGNALAQTIIGNDGDNIIDGAGGADILVGRAGDDTINGGAGDDTAVYLQNLSDYTLTDLGTRVHVSGPDGADTLTGIEHLRFADGMIDFNDGDPLFDTLFYMSSNPDVFAAGVDAKAHYEAFGWQEGRDPNPFFSTRGYLSANADVRAAGVNPLEHYRASSFGEGRDPSALFDLQFYLVHSPDVAAAGADALAHYLSFGRAEGRLASGAVGPNIDNGFDAEFYLLANPDVGFAAVDPLLHFNEFGWEEGRDPNAYFDTSGYLATYTDVADAGIDPLDHYMQFGWTEGRDPSAQFDTGGYLAANPDVDAADINQLQHFLQFGLYEGRMPVNDGLWG